MRTSDEGPIWPRWTTGDRLRKSRTAAGLTQSQMAEACEIGLRTVVNWENDARPPKRHALRTWSEITGVDIEFLDPDGVHRSVSTDESPDGERRAA